MVEPRGEDAEARGYTMTKPGWSKREKEIARQAFDATYERECHAIAEEARKGMAGAHDAAGLWRVRYFLSKERKKIDQKYDYRYSVLTRVFGILNRRGMAHTRRSRRTIRGKNGGDCPDRGNKMRLFPKSKAATIRTRASFPTP
jgi:hypothetical protein